MSAEHWRRLDRLFLDAMQIAPAQRERFVTDSAGADETLARDALGLLAAADRSGPFLERSALESLARTIAADGWSLRPGERLGAYVVVRLLGSGGNGEVWQARDERLGRDVAIKVLLPHVSADPGQLRRFVDEARTAGALNHANLLTVHDVGEHNGVPFLVSECLEGQSLRQRLVAGPIRVDEAVGVALGLAAGLSAAHRRGIVHRDLKPENVFLRAEGGVKILDFGLAKLQLAPGAPGEAASVVSSAIAGTAGYMAPEQVRGDEVDGRADLFALGVILYELLAREHPFRKSSTFETLQAILDADPPALADRAPAVPRPLARIVTRLLEKSPAARFHSAPDLAWALEQSLAADGPPAPAAAGSSSRTRSGARWPWLLSGALAVLAAAGAWVLGSRSAASPAPAVTRFTWALPAGVGLDSAPVVSPDGRSVAFTGVDRSGPRLYVRALDAFEARAVPGSEGAQQPFWSPDSEWIAFFSRTRLKKVAVAGGPVQTVVDAVRSVAAGPPRSPHGGTWSRSGRIVFGAPYGGLGLSQVPADGGAVTAATVPVPGRTKSRFPAFLPDGTHFLFYDAAVTEDLRGLYVGNTDAPPQPAERRLVASESEALYVPLTTNRGVLLYLANGRVQAQPFDPVRRELAGQAQSLSIEAGGPTLYHSPLLGASPDVLAYAPSPIVVGNPISSIAEAGGDITPVNGREIQMWPRLSADGRFLAWLRVDQLVANADIWVEDLARRTRVRVTTAIGRDFMPVWSPDGSRLVYRPEFADPRRLNVIAADGSGAIEPLTCPRAYCEPTDWSRDGRSIVVNAYDDAGVDVWSIGVTPDVASKALLAEPFTERDARLSPDGRWIAYVSDETGRPEVSIRSTVERPRRYVISSGGGSQPVWSPGGRALYFVDAAGRLRKVSARAASGELTIGPPVALDVPPIGAGHTGTQYDVSAGGRVYFLDQREPVSRPTKIRIVLGWTGLLPVK